MDRIIIFIDSRCAFAQTLLPVFLAEVKTRADLDVAAVLDMGHESLSRTARRYLRWMAIRLFNPDDTEAAPRRAGMIIRACRQHAILYMTPKHPSLGHASFLHFLQQELRATMALSIGCMRIFPPALLDALDMVVNYHNGRLPGYRGLRVTEWAVYLHEAEVGFTFHHMTAGIDEGPVLASGTVPATDFRSTSDLEEQKTQKATRHCGAVLDKMQQRDPGVPQAGAAQYFGRREFLAIRRIGEPGTITWSELQRRIRCFGLVHLNLAGRSYPVSAVTNQPGRSGHSFITADGVHARATRFLYLPCRVYQAARGVRGTR